MKKFILGLIILSSTAALARDMEEEAILLNQELQFLQESANTPSVKIAEQVANKASPRKAGPPDSLEQMYFEEDSEVDAVTTKAAGRKRRKVDD